MPRFRLFGCLMILGSMGTTALGGILAPTAIVAGKSQNDWAEDWWQWAANAPMASNPVIDPTGAFSHLGNQGEVFFLAGVFGGGAPINRTVTVTSGQHLFFPLLNAITWDKYSLYPDDFPRDLIETIGDVNSLFAELNGVALAPPATLTGWLQQSPDNYDQRIEAGGFFNETGDPVGVVSAQARGYWLMLSPLSVGTHTLRFGGMSTPNGGYAGVFPPNIQDITYTINVVPEPSSLLLCGVGVAVSAGLALRNRRTRGVDA